VRPLSLVLINILFLATALVAQEGNGISFSGSAGTYGELYSMKGITARRPHTVAQVFARGTLTWGGLQFPIDMFLSTEDNLIRQTINRISLGYRNSWLDVRLGDAYPMYSPLLINGAFVRGLHTIVRASGVKVQFDFGENQRPINGDPAKGVLGMYQRFIYTGSVGYETPAYFVFVHALRAKDEISSITTPGFYTTPQENLIVGAQIGANFFTNTLQAKVELDRSLWTRDIRSLPAAEGKIPGAFSSLFAERPGTTSDVAFRTDLTYRHQAMSVIAMYQRIGSGYNSMGVFGFQPDWQEVRVQAFAPLLNNALNLSGYIGTKSDNLDGKKFATTTRTGGGLNAGYRLSETYAINTNYSLYLDRNDAALAAKVDQVSHNVLIQPMRDWGDFSERQHADVMIGYTSITDHVVRQFASFGYTRFSLGGNYMRNFSTDLSAYLNYQFSRNRSSFKNLLSHSGSIGTNYTVIQAKLTTGGQITYRKESASNNAANSSQLQLRLYGNYRFTASLQLQCDVEGTSYSSSVAGGAKYTELKSSLTLTQQF